MKPANIDDYISMHTLQIQEKLRQMRHLISSAAPEAEECISYGMPAFRQKKVLVYFAAFKQHIGFFPTSSGIEAFSHKLGDYEFSKGAIRFYYDREIPEELVKEIVRFRVAAVMQ